MCSLSLCRSFWRWRCELIYAHNNMWRFCRCLRGWKAESHPKILNRIWWQRRTTEISWLNSLSEKSQKLFNRVSPKQASNLQIGPGALIAAMTWGCLSKSDLGLERGPESWCTFFATNVQFVSCYCWSSVCVYKNIDVSTTFEHSCTNGEQNYLRSNITWAWEGLRSVVKLLKLLWILSLASRTDAPYT